MNNTAQKLNFIGQWLKNPLQTGAIMPSGKELAALMVRDIEPLAGRVIEFGGGTGAFTQALLDRGVPPEMLEVVEINRDFAKNLRKSFPQLRIIEESAATLTNHVAGANHSYAYVISGLPLLSIPKPIRDAIIVQAFELLTPDGLLIQFSYSPRCPVSKTFLTANGLVAEKIGSCSKNIPPAYVFAIKNA